VNRTKRSASRRHKRRCRISTHRKPCSSTRRWRRSSTISKSPRAVMPARASRTVPSPQLRRRWLKNRRQFHPTTRSRSRLLRPLSRPRLPSTSHSSSYSPISAAFRIDAGRRCKRPRIRRLHIIGVLAKESFNRTMTGTRAAGTPTRHLARESRDSDLEGVVRRMRAHARII
jgi:hypothetical protein